jgi:hypothetical protein
MPATTKETEEMKITIIAIIKKKRRTHIRRKWRGEAAHHIHTQHTTQHNAQQCRISSRSSVGVDGMKETRSARKKTTVIESAVKMSEKWKPNDEKFPAK